MKTLFMYKGLPGSGKSTHAKAQVEATPGAFVRVNKDELREMTHNGHWSRENEKLILGIRNQIIQMGLAAGKHVIVDDTNFEPKHEQDLRSMAKAHNAHFEVCDFTHVSIETCIERDLKRPRSVGEAVIRKMYRDYLEPKPPVIEHDPALPNCLIVDIDGTIAHNDGHRGWFDWTKVIHDKPHSAVLEAIKAQKEFYGMYVDVIYVSGREETCRRDTSEWLIANNAPVGQLHMRPAGDSRDDTIVKREIYDREIAGKFNVIAVWDDRPKVVRMWRSLGLKVFDVGNGVEF